MTVRIFLSLVAIVTSLACTVLLFRTYLKQRVRLLLWSGLCFVGLTLNNVLLFADIVLFPDTDMRLLRVLASLLGIMFLLFGFIGETVS